MKDLDERLERRMERARGLAARYQAWALAHPEVVGARGPAVDRDCAALETDLERLRRAAGRRMCVGVFGASQAGKSYLISALASKPGEQLTALAGGRELRFIGDINPVSSNAETTGVVTRFTRLSPGEDAEFPMRLTLLSEMDLAKILSNAFYADFDSEARARLEPPSVAQILGEAGSGPESAAHDKAYELADYLKAQLPPEIYAANFEAFAPFWRRLSTAIETGGLEARVAAYSLLWRQEPYLTGVFRKLAEALEALGGAEACRASPEVFSEPHNVVLVSTQDRIWTGTGVLAKVKAENGRIAEIDHAVLSALIAELTVVIARPPAAFFDRADLLDFPGARTRSPADAVTQGNVGGALTRGKVAYLFNRYLETRELSSMLLCIKDSVQEVGDLKRMVDRWISISHGATARARQGQDCALFVVLTKADLLFETPPEGARKMLADRMESSFERFVGSGDKNRESREGSLSWKEEWLPGRPFDNMFWLRNTKMDSKFIRAEGERNSESFREVAFVERYADLFAAFSEAVGSLEVLRRHFAEPREAWEEMLKLNDGGRSRLLGKIDAVCRPDFKLKRLEREFEEAAVRLRILMREFHADGDLGRIYAERMARAQEIVGLHIRETASQHKFGELLDVCQIRESEAREILRRLNRGETDVDLSYLPKSRLSLWDKIVFGEKAPEEEPAPALRSETLNEQFARLVIARWEEKLAQNLGNPRILRYFPIPAPLLEGLFEEMKAGARRVGLAETIAEGSRAAGQFPRRSEERMINHRARLAAQAVNRFVNHLGVEEGEIKAGDGRPIFSRPRVASGAPPVLPREREAADELVTAIGAYWSVAFMEMASRNARSLNGLEGVNLEANAELAKLLGDFEETAR